MVEDENTKEEFCGACAAIPTALVGAGIAGASTQQKGTHDTRKKIMLVSGIVLVVVSVIITIIYLRTCKKCKA